MSEKISYRKESVLLLLVLSILPYPWLFCLFRRKGSKKNAEESIASQRSLLLQTQNNQQKTTVI